MDGSSKKPIRSTAASRARTRSALVAAASPAAGPSSSTESVAKNGASPASSITENLMKKFSSDTISPLKAGGPGRLPSIRADRDLTLGGLRPGAQAAGDGGAKPKKVFTPTIPARRVKAEAATEEKSTEVSNNGKSHNRWNKDDGTPGRGRGRGRGKPALIQTTDGLFADGVTELARPGSHGSSYRGDKESSSSASAMEKPTINPNMGKIDKEQEQDAYDRLMKGDFVNDGRDNDIVMQPIQLPKANLEYSIKEDGDIDMKTEPEPITAFGGVKIKQEKEDGKPTPPPPTSSSSCQRRLKPSQMNMDEIIHKEGDILFIQLPDVLPNLKLAKERPPTVKVELGAPSTAKESNQAPSTGDAQPGPEGVFDDIAEGLVGTLRVHKSGRITLKMGEFSFILDSATQVSFLQDLISIDINTQEKSGKMTALGPIKYKAVCLPDWEQLIEDE